MSSLKPANLVLLTAIMLGGFFLRLYQVESLPTILNRDEAALAYNAFLLAETGQDEFGRAWPTMLESFGDFKLPGYPNVLVVLFSVLGLSDAVVRLPSVISGTLLILVAFWYGLMLFKDHKHRATYGLLSAILVATLPVFWFYSRMAYEANVALFLVALSLGMLIFNRKASSWVDLVAISLWWLAALFYNTPLLLLPFVVLALPLHRGLRKPHAWLGPVAGLLIVFAGVFSQLVSLTAQKSGITIFSDETVWMLSVEYRSRFSGIFQTLFGNKYVFYFQLMLRNILSSFSPEFLVTKGGTHPWHSVPDWGHLSWLAYITGILGISTVVWKLVTQLAQYFKRKTSEVSSDWLWLFFLFGSLIPASITVDAPHATRSLLFFFVWVLFSVKGIAFLGQVAARFKFGHRVFLLLLLGAIGFSAASYGATYFTRYPKLQPGSMKPGYNVILKQVLSQYPDSSIAVVDPDGYQYVITAWYLRTDPEVFQSSIVKQLPNQIGFRYGERFGQFHFIGHPEDREIEGEDVLIDWTGTEWRVEPF